MKLFSKRRGLGSGAGLLLFAFWVFLGLGAEDARFVRLGDDEDGLREGEGDGDRDRFLLLFSMISPPK
jgi:hypothetical protein